MKLDYAPLVAEKSTATDRWQLDSSVLPSVLANDPAQRTHLVRQLNRLLHDLQQFGIPLEVWIDASGGANKREPAEIDVVAWVREADVELLPAARLQQFDGLFNYQNHDRVKATYDLNLHLGNPANERERAFWSDLLGHSERTPHQRTQASNGLFSLALNHV